jgi:hypothetical protein
MTLAKVHQLLLGKANFEAEEAQRHCSFMLIMNCGAVAGLKLAMGDAREQYAETLRQMDAKAAGITVDSLQRRARRSSTSTAWLAAVPSPNRSGRATK